MTLLISCYSRFRVIACSKARVKIAQRRGDLLEALRSCECNDFIVCVNGVSIEECLLGVCT